MLFPTHLLAGYLLGRRITGRPAWAVCGAALPDVVDKPLGVVGVTELYHSVGHSALSLAVLAAIAFAARRPDNRSVAPTAVGLGWVSHLLLDVAWVGLGGRPENWVLLLWPVVRKPNPSGLGPGAFVSAYVPSWPFFAEVGIWVGAVLILLGPRVAGWADRARG